MRSSKNCFRGKNLKHPILPLKWSSKLLSASFCAWCFLEIPVERSLPVFYRMKPENISCEANVFPTENRGLFFNDTSNDILKDCVIVDKLGIHELQTVIWPIRVRYARLNVRGSQDKPTISYQRNITALVTPENSEEDFFCDLNHLGKLKIMKFKHYVIIT